MIKITLLIKMVRVRLKTEVVTYDGWQISSDGVNDQNDSPEESLLIMMARLKNDDIGG